MSSYSHYTLTTEINVPDYFVNRIIGEVTYRNIIMKNIVNGIDMTEFQQFAEGVSQDPSISKARFNVETR